MLNLIQKKNKNAVGRLEQENAVEIIERTETAGNVIQTKQEEIMETNVQSNNEISVTIPINLIVESLAKNDNVINVVYDKVKEKIEPLEDEQIDDRINEWFDDSSNVYSFKEEIKDDLTESFDDRYLTSDNVMDEIRSDVEDIMNDSAITEDWIQSNLDDYTRTDPVSHCRLGRSVWNAVVNTISTDINIVLDSIVPVKSGDYLTAINERSQNSSVISSLNTSVIALIRLIELVSQNVVKKAGLSNEFNKATKVEIIEDLVPSTAYPCTHFKITTYTDEQAQRLKEFLFDDKTLQTARVQALSSNDSTNPL